MSIQRYRAADLENLMDRITKNSIGVDDYINKFFNETQQNYPPYNIIQVKRPCEHNGDFDKGGGPQDHRHWSRLVLKLGFPGLSPRLVESNARK